MSINPSDSNLAQPASAATDTASGISCGSAATEKLVLDKPISFEVAESLPPVTVVFDNKVRASQSETLSTTKNVL
jgi:hypothetical protein